MQWEAFYLYLIGSLLSCELLSSHDGRSKDINLGEQQLQFKMQDKDNVIIFKCSIENDQASLCI